jgi:hypothetical protein
MDAFGSREPLVGEYEQFTRSFAYAEHDLSTRGRYIADYNPCPATEQRQPFDWNPEHCALPHIELDVGYARLCGPTRDELRYILDAKCVMGAAHSSETFRSQKDGEIRAYRAYRTQRLALKALANLERQ